LRKASKLFPKVRDCCIEDLESLYCD